MSQLATYEVASCESAKISGIAPVHRQTNAVQIFRILITFTVAIGQVGRGIAGEHRELDQLLAHINDAVLYHGLKQMVVGQVGLSGPRSAYGVSLSRIASRTVKPASATADTR